jgi:hypothetical protein
MRRAPPAASRRANGRQTVLISPCHDRFRAVLVRLHLRRVGLIWRKSPWTAFRIIEKLRIIESTQRNA